MKESFFIIKRKSTIPRPNGSYAEDYLGCEYGYDDVYTAWYYNPLHPDVRSFSSIEQVKKVLDSYNKTNISKTYEYSIEKLSLEYNLEKIDV